MFLIVKEAAKKENLTKNWKKRFLNRYLIEKMIEKQNNQKEESYRKVPKKCLWHLFSRKNGWNFTFRDVCAIYSSWKKLEKTYIS